MYLLVKLTAQLVNHKCDSFIHLTPVRLSTVPYFSVGFSRLVRFNRTPAILVCNGERNLGRVSKLPMGPRLHSGKTQIHARTLRERRAPKVSKMAAISIFLFSTIYYATADIPVSSANFPTQEDSYRCNLAVVRFSYGFLNFKKDFKALDVPAACKQIAYTGLLLSWTILQKATIKENP